MAKQPHGRWLGTSRFAIAGVIAISATLYVLLSLLARQQPRLAPAPAPSLRDWWADCASAAVDARHAPEGPGASLPGLVGHTFAADHSPILPDFRAAGFLVTGSATALHTAPGLPRATLVLELTAVDESGDTFLLAVAETPEPLARFDTFSRPQPLLPGDTAYMDDRGPGGTSALAFSHGGFVWCVTGAAPDQLALLRDLVLHAPSEVVEWGDL